MESMADKRSDLVLPQGTYVLIQDGASGNVEVVVGPHKVSMADTDTPVIFDHKSGRYIPVNTQQEAIQTCPRADEGQYVVLTNPAQEANQHPAKGKQQGQPLKFGTKINIPGPETFALFPGQQATVIAGHQLKSNEYLLTRVYNDDAAKANLENAIVKSNDSSNQTKKSKVNALIGSEELITGALHIIKGTEVSFYIPPTGIEVVPDENGNYIRNAITLERLEYCILLDENGDKRYVIGPSVVFPKPTETFVTQNGNPKYKAIELNENMGIYVKVIADYTEDKKSYKAGEELFITGKEQKIYFPRPEHALIKYGNRTITYAVAIPAGDARYVLDKTSGKINLVKGPKMFLADPRTEVVVRRVLDVKSVELWYPGNDEAIRHNIALAGEAEGSMDYVSDETLSNKTYSSTKARANFGDMLFRSETFTKPRTIQLDGKYDGAVTINIWPGYAIQVVKKTGEREVMVGPKVVLLEYDQTLETLELSTGKPKSDHNLLKTAYLQTHNNNVSDIVSAETKDLVNVDVRLTYRVNFTGEPTKWFSVSNYVKLLTEHLRSLIRNAVKKLTIEEFNDKATDIIRDVILGAAKDGKRPGRGFDENGMHVYDVDVLDVTIGDGTISKLLKDAQHNSVQQHLRLQAEAQEVEFVKKDENFKRQKIQEMAKTEDEQHKVRVDKIKAKKLEEKIEVDSDLAKQDALNKVTEEQNKRTIRKQEIELTAIEKASAIKINEIEKSFNAIQPKLIEAILTQGKNKFAETLATNLKAQGDNPLAGLFQKGGWDGIMETVKGSPLEQIFKDLMNQGLDDLKQTKK